MRAARQLGQRTSSANARGFYLTEALQVEGAMKAKGQPVTLDGIRRFLGTTLNAIRTQIAAALIAYLLLRMAHAAQRTVLSILTFARLVRANLMHFRAFTDLAAPPPPPAKLPGQMNLQLT